jgi:hypothetical protein
LVNRDKVICTAFTASSSITRWAINILLTRSQVSRSGDRHLQQLHTFMSSTAPSNPSTRLGKRKRQESYDELVIKFESLRDKYNAVVPIYNSLRRQVEQAQLDYQTLNVRYQELLRRNNTLLSINWHSDISLNNQDFEDDRRCK